MDQRLRAQFSQDELALAASIGSQETALSEKILSLFGQLPDPLLSAAEIHELLDSDESIDQIKGDLQNMVTERELESSDTTLRPLDRDQLLLYRRAGSPVARLKLLGIESELGDGTSRLQFTCDGRIIRSIAQVDRLETISGTGQQREEIRRHVDQISQGIQSGTQVPTSVLLVFADDRISDEENGDPPESFIVIRPQSDWVSVSLPGGDQVIQRLRPVEIDLPYRRAAFDEEKSALLVDGQQRTAALSLVDIDEIPSLALSVNATLADEDEAKRIFHVANSTRKIATQFSRALLATMDDAPGYLLTERARAVTVKRLALEDSDSPFFQLAQHPGVKVEKRPPIAYNSLFQVVSAFDTSALPFESDADLLAYAVSKSFSLVKEQWPTVWGLRPGESRLMHGAGLRSVAHLLVEMMKRHYDGDLKSEKLWRKIEQSLKRLKPVIAWSALDAEKATQRAKRNFIDEILPRQNTSQDIKKLGSFLEKESLALDTKKN